MADSELPPTNTYRLLNRSGEVIGVRDLPTDGEALAWADQVHRQSTPRVWIRRVERNDDDTWTFVSQAG